MDNEEFDFLETGDLDGLLGGETRPKPVVVVSKTNPVVDLADLDPSLRDDLNASRATLRAQQEIMMQLALSMAPEVMLAEHPKMVEAFAKLMAQMTSASKALVDVHKVTKDAKAVASITTNNQQINAEKVFIGTHGELLSKMGTRQDTHEKEVNSKAVKYDPEKNRATE
jgi:D-alanyl-D-alanine dipeptidase